MAPEDSGEPGRLDSVLSLDESERGSEKPSRVHLTGNNDNVERGILMSIKNFEELVEVLSRSGVTDVMVSASWEAV